MKEIKNGEVVQEVFDMDELDEMLEDEEMKESKLKTFGLRAKNGFKKHKKKIVSEKQHPRYSQGTGIFDRCIFFVHDVPPQNIFCNSSEHMQQEKTDYANLFAIGCIFLLLWSERR